MEQIKLTKRTLRLCYMQFFSGNSRLANEPCGWPELKVNIIAPSYYWSHCFTIYGGIRSIIWCNPLIVWTEQAKVVKIVLINWHRNEGVLDYIFICDEKLLLLDCYCPFSKTFSWVLYRMAISFFNLCYYAKKLSYKFLLAYCRMNLVQF